MEQSAGMCRGLEGYNGAGFKWTVGQLPLHGAGLAPATRETCRSNPDPPSTLDSTLSTPLFGTISTPIVEGTRRVIEAKPSGFAAFVQKFGTS